MLLLDISLRFPAITVLILISVLVMSEARHNLKARLLCFWLISLAALLLTTLPSELQIAWPLSEVFWILHTPNMVLLWLFGLSMFIDGFKLRLWHWAIVILFLSMILTLRILDQNNNREATLLLLVVYRTLRAFIIGHLFWVILSGRASDLFEPRRSARLWWAFFSLSYIVFLLIIEAVLYSEFDNSIYFTAGLYDRPDWISTLRVALLAPFFVLGAILFLRGRFDALVYDQPTGPDAPEAGSFDPTEDPTYQRLRHAMETETIYRKSDLSIGRLARHVQTSEHQLRKLINQGLGFRNFSSYLNSYRLKDAKAALADPLQARTTVQQIALESGYASLATFNRAFRSSENLSPSAYRSALLKQHSADPLNK